MNNSSRIFVIVIVATVAFASGWFLHIKNPDLFAGVGSVTDIREGVYDLIGSNPEGGPEQYQGTVTISRDGLIYGLEWNIAGRQKQQGVGILERGVLSVGYLDTTSGTLNDAGVVSYVADSNDRLHGTWVSAAGGSRGSESLWWKSDR